VRRVPKDNTPPCIHTLWLTTFYRADPNRQLPYRVTQGAEIASEQVTAVLRGLLTLGYWHSLTMLEVLGCIATKFLRVRCIC
jgi:hypothetical protein